jgi:hypothetical protein
MGTNGNGLNGTNGEGNPPGTHLVIPYFTGDPGSRPLPSADPFWMCTSILINGSPYAGQKLTSGETVNLSLDAVNYGQLTTPATCVFFWADPTTVFTKTSVQLANAQNPALPSSSNGSWARSTSAVTACPPIAWIVPEGIPEHICLLAMITSPSDLAPQTYDAAGDRHWGQQNIQVVSAPPGGMIRIQFSVANGLETAGRFRVEVTSLAEHHEALRHVVAEHSPLRAAEAVRLRERRSGVEFREKVIQVELGAGERRDVELEAKVPADAVSGSTIILQVAQFSEQGRRPMGGLGVVVRVK